MNMTRDNFSSEVNQDKTENFFLICFCFAIAYARIVLLLVFISMFMLQASQYFFVLLLFMARGFKI